MCHSHFILEHYFEMHAVDAEEGLAMYKIFCAQVEEVVDYLTIIRKLSSLLNIPIPNLKHVSVTWSDSKIVLTGFRPQQN